ncbi:hypothetical protein PHET_01655 [Paragonimus heterotremus]|uniref:RING-type domain-containing protein n=1 Tax=Paragonimus heterotremus TaxID=100268 RepID=A0A8J4T5G0_9TREM|nr:hypothetical protein PHET_01655 [Paragonimus heterotremus]
MSGPSKNTLTSYHFKRTPHNPTEMTSFSRLPQLTVVASTSSNSISTPEMRDFSVQTKTTREDASQTDSDHPGFTLVLQRDFSLQIDITDSDEAEQLPQPAFPMDLLPTRRLSHEEARTNGECSVCLEKYHPDDEVITLTCFHFFHSRCARDWFSKWNTCPLCRIRPFMPE